MVWDDYPYPYGIKKLINVYHYNYPLFQGPDSFELLYTVNFKYK